MGRCFFATNRIRSLSLSKGTCLQRYVGTSTTLSDRVGGTSNASCKDKPPPSVTLNLIQGLYKPWLNVLQIPNQVRDDGLDGGSSLGRRFFATNRIRSLSQSKGTCLQRYVGTSTTLSDRVGGTRVYLANGAAPSVTLN